ncbi:MAG: NAD-dependent epimerase/dehydratase family protein [Myxococcales bacterium]|nr:NAD-dependent epimerase/dehydratase family protein [Myxococcales bacterium]
MRTLRAADQRVRAVSRSGRAAVPDGVEHVGADATDASATRQACEGATVVYNCAAPPYTDWAALYPRMQEGIIAGAARASAVLVSAENVYVYGEVDGPMTEETPFNPRSRKGELRARMYERLLEAHRAGTVRAVAGRAPDYYGPHAVQTTVYGERVFYPALAGKPAEIFGKPDARHTWIFVDDFARGLVTLGAHEEALGRHWHLPCPPPLRQRELLEMIFAAAGHEPRVRAMPTWLTPILGWFIPIMRELAEMQYQWIMDYDFRSAAFQEAFADEVTITPHADAVRETLAWFREHPK